MPRPGRSMATQSLKLSQGNSPLASTSAARGPMRSSAKARSAAWNWRCSSESVIGCMPQVSHPVAGEGRPVLWPVMIALVFPGQGSQRPGMGAAWQDHPSWSVVTRLGEETGRDLAELLVDADADTLKRTSNAQPATFAFSLMVLDAAP